MHHLLITIGAAALAFALWPGPAAAETSLGSLTNPGVPVVNAGYVRRYRTYYARKDYRSRCEGGGWAEIRELQRYWPQTLCQHAVLPLLLGSRPSAWQEIASSSSR